MFRYVITGGMLFAFMITLIVWATRPDMIETASTEIKKPLVEWKAAKEETVWETEKEKARKRWMRSLDIPSNCTNTTSAIREMECKNKLQLHQKAFEKMWSQKIAGGWRPEGID